MSSSVVRYKLYGKITKVVAITEHRRRYHVITFLADGKFITTIKVGDNFVKMHKPEVGQYLVKQEDDSTVVLTEAEFKDAVCVEEAAVS